MHKELELHYEILNFLYTYSDSDQGFNSAYVASEVDTDKKTALAIIKYYEDIGCIDRFNGLDEYGKLCGTCFYHKDDMKWKSRHLLAMMREDLIALRNQHLYLDELNKVFRLYNSD